MFNSYDIKKWISTPQYTQSPSSILIPKDPPLPFDPLSSTPVGFSPMGDPSHLPRLLLPPNLTASARTPNSGGGRNGSHIISNFDIACLNGTPASFKSNQQTGTDHGGRTHTGRGSKPYQRPTPSVTRNTRPRETRPITYEGQIEWLQQRCRIQGAEESAICLLDKAFPNGVDQAVLTRSLTDAEAVTGKKNFTISKRRRHCCQLEDNKRD